MYKIFALIIDYLRERHRLNVAEKAAAREEAIRQKAERDRFEKAERDWMLVEHSVSTCSSSSRVDGSMEYEYHIYYKLYENANGNRKVDISCDGKKPTDDIHDRDPYYHETVLPFKQGARNLDVDDYDEARKKLMLKKIKS